MNTNLHGKTILIGREQEHSRLCVSIAAGGKQLVFPLGAPQSVPNSVSRCQPAEGKAHCSLEIDNEGRIRITNMKAQNVTFVDGSEVLKKYIDENSRVTLGRDQYILELKPIIDAAANMVGKVEKPAPKTYSIAHLEDVMKEYNARNEEIDKEQDVTNLLMRVPFLVSAVSGVFTGVAKTSGMDQNLGNISLVLTIISAAVMMYGVYRNMTSSAKKSKKENMDEFKKKYVCPNPDCGRKLTNFDYEELLKMKKCPFCGSKFE